MTGREKVCKACEGTGMLADDEGWQYNCSICHGAGEVELGNQESPTNIKIMEVDENNRLLD